MKGAWTKRLQPHESERWVSRRVLEAYAVSQAGGESEDQSAVVGLADLGGAGGGRLDDAVLVVIATHIDRLRSHEPHGPVRWRFGCSQWQPISAALTSMGKEDECDVSRERCRQEREAARALGQQGREEPARLGGGPVVLGRPGGVAGQECGRRRVPALFVFGVWSSELLGFRWVLWGTRRLQLVR